MKKIAFVFVFLVCELAQPFVPEVWGQRKETGFDVSRNLEVFSNIFRTLDMYYVDTLSADTMMRWAIDGMLMEIDPYTVYYPDEENEALTQMMEGRYAGIGAMIRYYKRLDRCAIEEPYEGSPALEFGLKAGDVILSIDGKDTRGMRTSQVSRMLRGDAGTVFEVTVQRQGVEEPLSLKITRRQIQIPSIPWYGIVDKEQGVGYLALTSVTDRVAQDVRHAVTQMQREGMKRLVLDLRDNPGGSVVEAVEIVGMFVPKGTLVVSTRGKLSSTCYDYKTPSEPIDSLLPLTVMVNENSASAAEIISGALQDLDRATIYGQRTYGKGLVQAVREVPYRGELKITTAKYYIPSGRCIQAYDFRHRTADGAATTLPDSLTQEFRTSKGRVVRDGGGILPDSLLATDTLPTIVYDLVASDVFFEYVTHYAATHSEIAAPGLFRLTDAEYAEFVDTVSHADFTYNDRTLTALAQVRKIAEVEGQLEPNREAFEALEKGLKDKNLARDLQHFRSQIQPYVETAIVCRYYYQGGALRQQLESDKEFQRVLGRHYL